MIIIPAIDLLNQQCVRLLKGDFDKTTVYDVDPVAVATQYARDGAPLLHVVDLNGAKTGDTVNLSILNDLAKKVPVAIQAGGGIRSLERASSLLDSGVSRVIVGTMAMKDSQQVRTLAGKYGPERVGVALDVRPSGNGYQLTASGWLEAVDTPLEDLLKEYSESGLKHVLITDVSRDGAMSGPNFALYADLVDKYPQLRFQASGGIRSCEDITALRKSRLAGAVVGKALLEKALDLKEALLC